MPRPGGTTDRGYGAEHKAERERWRPWVESGEATCQEPICLEERDGRGRWLDPEQPWHLAHADGQSGYRGPAHTRCNTSEGARRMHAERARAGADDLWWVP